ncbi:MAG: HalOD1 output domain-containing protein [Haloarculaceae archaeon]
MSVDPEPGDPRAEGWRPLVAHDWDGPVALETSLRAALEEVGAEDVFLYDCVDVEAVRDAVSPGTDRGVSEVRFDYGHHEVRVTEDGSIAAR